MRLESGIGGTFEGLQKGFRGQGFRNPKSLECTIWIPFRDLELGTLEGFGIRDLRGTSFFIRDAAVHEPSGRTLEVYTDQPGVQVYTSNGLPETVQDTKVSASLYSRVQKPIV
ncbi:Galactose mutarotase [Frankliniella fusca]|uniref:Galactose mutarotase n=1 Tax=Frankliniella fusca TaxID=407009 RepID=A0AAE1LHY8_9NEOP|nr:Galactose mutarotase [Frankliniella fusca]